MRTHDLRAAIAVDDVVQSPRSRQAFDARTMPCNSCDTSTAMAVLRCPITIHVQPHTSTPRPQVAQRRTTITHLYDISKESADGSYRGQTQRHVQTLVAQNRLDRDVSNDLCLHRSGLQLCLKPLSARKATQVDWQSSNERPRASTSPKDTQTRIGETIVSDT